jgi:hypothetical protein
MSGRKQGSKNKGPYTKRNTAYWDSLKKITTQRAALGNGAGAPQAAAKKAAKRADTAKPVAYETLFVRNRKPTVSQKDNIVTITIALPKSWA